MIKAKLLFGRAKFNFNSQVATNYAVYYKLTRKTKLSLLNIYYIKKEKNKWKIAGKIQNEFIAACGFFILVF